MTTNDVLPAEAPHLLTRAEAAELARVSTRTVARWIASKRLKAIKTHPGRTGRVLVPKAALLAMLTGGAS
jgi:excisionase family DNA binding protein